MANIQPKIDYNDGDILHGSDLNASNEVIKAGVDDNFARIQELDLEKQENLDADVDYLTPSTASETYEVKKGANDFYVTNDEKIKLSNTSGVNTGDETKASIETKLGKASATNNGYLSKEDHTLFNDKQEELVSGTNIKTINGNSVLGSGNITIAGGSGSGSGDVVGPDSSMDMTIPVFDGTTGKIIKDSGVTFNYIDSTLDNFIELFQETFLLKEDKLPETPAEPESKFLNGNKQWAPIVVGSGGYASNIYMTNIVSDLVPAYKKSSSINDTVETIVSATCNNNEVLAATYLYDTDLATEIVDAGSWRFNLFSAIDAAAGDSKFKVEVFERLANGTEIVLFSAYSGTIENRVGYEGYMYNMIETIQPSFNVNLTSRLGHRIYATTTAGDRTLSYKIGDGSASYLNTPLALRHSQLRDKNAEELYQHITQTEKDNIENGFFNQDARITTAEGEIANGWNSIIATLSFASYDATTKTGVIDTSVDLTAIISLGMKLKFTQSTVQFGKIVEITSTNMTVFFGTDYSLVDSAITLPYYSMLQAPYGFPSSDDKWTLIVKWNTSALQTNPVTGTWYNLGTRYIDLPKGCFKVSFGTDTFADASTAGRIDLGACLSTSNNSVSDYDLLVRALMGNLILHGAYFSKEKEVTLTAPTRYYLNMAVLTGTCIDLGADGRAAYNASPIFIKAVCAY